MISLKKNTYLKVFGALALTYAALFFLYYTTNYLAYDVLADKKALFNTLENVRYFLYDGIEFLVPPVIATLVLIHYASGRVLSGILLSFPLALGKFAYNLPYFYLYHTVLGYEWLGAILGSLAVTVGYALALALYSSAIAGVGYFVLKSQRGSIAKFGEPSPTYDFTVSGTRAIFAVCLTTLFTEFIIEVVNVIQFFTEYGTSYALGEIIFMSACLAFLPVMLLVSQLVAVHIKNASAVMEKKEKKRKKRS